MHLADHIRPLLRDHDCVIIPDFGGLVADVSPARAQPGRQALSPPTKLVAFNQALTRNDGLLVDALSQYLNMPIAQAREAVRAAVASLQQELEETNRTELPGIGIFRRAAGRGLAFEYTGTDNLLASAFGLPELAARPVRANDARPRPQPALRGAITRRTRWARLLPGGAIAIAAGLLLLANYQVALNVGYLPASWRTQLPKWEIAQRQETTAPSTIERQQANLGQHDFSSPMATEGMTPLENPASAPVPTIEAQPTARPEAATVTATTDNTAVSTTKPEPAVAAVAAPAKPAESVAPAPVVAAEKPAEVAIAAKAPAASTKTESATIIKNRTGRYYVIAGAYLSYKAAETSRKALARKGHPTHIILPYPGSRLFRLTAADYPNLASAQQQARRLRISTRSDFNTLKF